MGYYLKHSAKGTTWGDHKYIRKEGNRYIYPEDVKKVASNNTFTLGKDGQTVRLDSNGNPTNYGKVNYSPSQSQSSSESKDPYEDLSNSELKDKLQKDVESGKLPKEYASEYYWNKTGDGLYSDKSSSSESKDPYEDLSNSELKDKLQKDVESGKLPKEYASEYYWNKTGDGLYSDKSSSAEAKKNALNIVQSKEFRDGMINYFSPKMKKAAESHSYKHLNKLLSLIDKEKQPEAYQIYKEEVDKRNKDILERSKDASDKHRDIEAKKRKEALRNANRTNYMPAIDRAKQQSVKQKENAKYIQSTSAAAGYIKRKDDPANRYRLVPNAEKRQAEIDEKNRRKQKAQITADNPFVKNNLYRQSSTDNKRFRKDATRAQAIKAYQRDRFNAEDIDKGNELASKRSKIRTRNRHTKSSDIGNLHIRTSNHQFNPYSPEQTIRVIKKKKRTTGGGGHRR